MTEGAVGQLSGQKSMGSTLRLCKSNQNWQLAVLAAGLKDKSTAYA